MAKRFSTLQKEAEDKGYSLTQSGDRYYASWEGINLDDDDRERLVDDMDSVIECSAEDSEFNLSEEPNDKGEAVITVQGLPGEFSDISIAKALAKAKEAKLAKDRPSPSKRAFSRAPKAAPAPVPQDTDGGLIEDEPDDRKPGMALKEVEPWDEPKPASQNGPAQAFGQDDKAVLARLCGKMAELLLEAQRLLELKDEGSPLPQPGAGRPRISRGR